MDILKSRIEGGHRLPAPARLIVPLLGLFFLVYPVQVVLGGTPTRVETLVALGGAGLFATVFLWLMWGNEPLRLSPAGRAEVFRVRAAICFLLVLVGALSYALGQEWRMLLFYHTNVAAGIMLPKRDAYVAVAGISLLTLVFGIPTGFAWLAFPALAIGLWSISFVGQVETVAQLRAAREELARLAVNEERLRFARDLHDLLGHSLSLIALKSELAERLLSGSSENEKAAREVRELQGVARGALREVREAVSGYRRLSLGEELEGARRMLEAAGIRCRVVEGAGSLPEDVEATLRWVVREGSTNVVRHSRAKRCEIRLSVEGGRVSVRIQDDGRGPRMGSGLETSGSGLKGLAERVGAGGGRFEAGPRMGGGFALRVSLPLASGPREEPATGGRARMPGGGSGT